MVGPEQDISGPADSLHAHFHFITKRGTHLELDKRQMISDAVNAERGWMFNLGLPTCENHRDIA